MKIKIKNFGPCKIGFTQNEGWIEIKKVTVFIGDDGNGKSTVSKLISTFLWIEKALICGKLNEEDLTASNFKDKYCGYHKLANYFIKDKTELFYEGQSYKLHYTTKGEFLIYKVSKDSLLPQIMYVPSNRNIISIIDNLNLPLHLTEPLYSFFIEYTNAKKQIEKVLELPLENMHLEYDEQTGLISIKNKDFKIRLDEASNGFQSMVPLYLVSWYLSNLVRNPVNSSKKKVRDSFINIIEEPEQSLSPDSQITILQRLLAMNNLIPANKLIITTNSPYVINCFTIAIKTEMIKSKMKLSPALYSVLNQYYPTDAGVAPFDIVIYEFNKNGDIKLLDTYKGLPSDGNYLNNMLEQTNSLFSDLLDLEDKI